jgi:hypothetical protein
MNSLEEDSSAQHMNFEISNIKEITPISKIFETSYKDQSFDRSRLQKLEKAIYYAKVLSITIQNTDIFHKKIIINALGCETSLRGIKDGQTFFGSKKKDSKGGTTINDIVLPLVTPELAESYRGKHFMISYDLSRDSYFIKDLRLGFGTYYRLTSSIDLKNNTLILIGETYILTSFLQTYKESSKIKLKIYGKGIGDVFFFSASDCSENCITIGRQETCDVRLQGSLVSKVHCTIFYTPEKGWVLYDGDIASNQLSRNGTWIYISDNIEIFDSMVFKSGRVLFRVDIL